MATATTADPPARTPILERYYGVHPLYRLGIRWLLIIALTAIAFGDTFVSLADTTREGGLGGYVWTVPLVATLVSIGVARRKRTNSIPTGTDTSSRGRRGLPPRRRTRVLHPD
ncbi:MAG: hypothetical protein U5N53_23980 [Mycobacterium sp.]|nr:hypothetical protein [Mycobacterium sp.]